MNQIKTVKNKKKSQTLEERKKEALFWGDKISQILRQDFRATEVIIFGSARGDTPWHWQSDLDIAVKGMSNDGIWDAYSMIENITPMWLKVDLVAIEKVPLRVRMRILEEESLPNNKYLALKCRIEDEMIAIEENFETFLQILAKLDQTEDIIILPALASYINDFYKGVERISKRVAVTLDGSIPSGEHWYQELLRQVADSGEDNRPPLWNGSLLLQLDEYRKFRSLVLNIYNFQLKKEKLLLLAQNVEPVLNKIKAAITVFYEWLEEKAKDSN